MLTSDRKDHRPGGMSDRTFFKQNYASDSKPDRDNYADLIYQYIRRGPAPDLHERDHFNIIGSLVHRPHRYSNDRQESRCCRVSSEAKWHWDLFCNYKNMTDLHHYTILSLEAFFHEEETKWTS